MTTRTRLTMLLVAALLSQQAAAMEEVVVYGTDTSVQRESVSQGVSQRVLAAMNEFLEELRQAQKARLDAELQKLGEQRIQLAAAHLPTRG